MDNERRKPWLPLLLLAGALLVWAAVLGLGAFLEPSADRPQNDIRKMLVVLASMGAFLTFWGLALWFRSHRK